MADDEVLPEQWAQEGVQLIEKAVSEWNTHYPEIEPVRVVWGYRDRETAEREQSRRPDHAGQCGLLSWDDFEVDLWFFEAEDPTRPQICLLDHFFPEAYILRSRRDFYWVFDLAVPGVQVSLGRDDKDIVTYGVAVWLPLESLTGRILRDAMMRLLDSAAEVVGYLDPDDDDADEAPGA